MSTTHTPGPWKAEQFADRINVWPISRKKPDGSAVAYDMTAADARLIAAAPDLLAACQDVLREYAEFAGLWTIDTESDGVTACRAAIAKATGARP
jgi:hypothetical protein